MWAAAAPPSSEFLYHRGVNSADAVHPSQIRLIVGLTGSIFQGAEHFALRRHPLDVRVVLQGQQAAWGGLADVDQLKVAGEVGGGVFSGNNVPLQLSVAGTPKGAADVQTASFGWEIASKRYDVLWKREEKRLQQQTLLSEGISWVTAASP